MNVNTEARRAPRPERPKSRDRRFPPRSLLLLAACLTVSIGCVEDEQPSDRLHVVLVTIDTLRADRLGIHGYERDTSPALDRFFESGTAFTRATSTTPCTIPSMQQLLTGRLVDHVDSPTLAQMLRAHGYQTAAIVSQHQFRHGRLTWFDRGFDSFDIQGLRELDRHGLSTRAAAEVTDRALTWLGEERGAGPFFLWLHYFDPHDPYWPPAAERRFVERAASPHRGDRRVLGQELAGESRLRRRYPRFEAADAERFADLYDEEVAYTDAQLGRLFEHLEQLGLVDESIVIVTSDHGERLGEDGMWDHCKTLRPPEMHVPLLVRVAGEPLAAGPRDDSITSTLDVVPTLVALLGLERRGDETAVLDGEDLRSVPSGRRVIASWNGWQSIREGDWSLYRRGDSLDLYRVRTDPREREDLADVEPATTTRLRAELDESRALTEPGESQSRETIEQLEALGYIE